MLRSIAAIGCLIAACSVALMALGQAPPPAKANDAAPADEKDRANGRTVAEWIADWDDNNFDKNQKAIAALAAAGEPAAKELIALIKNHDKKSGVAFQALGKMGERARVALPTLIDLANDKSAANPPGWTWNVSLRNLLFSEMKNMPWAAGELVPILKRVANDADEDEWSRLRAIESLAKMGPSATPILRELATHKDNAVRETANSALAEVAVAAGRSKEDAYEEIVMRNPFDVNVPEYLVKMQGIYNNSVTNPVTQRVKTLIRQRLADQLDAELAFSLATIIRNGLANTNLEFAAPSDSYRSQSPREDPAESYQTLAEALEIAFAKAPQGSELQKKSGRSLARLRLLAGDWDGMNAVLVKMDQFPIPADARATLPAPPFEWTNLRKDWQPADVAMSGGNAAIELEFEKDGRPLAGAHVLIKKVPPQENGFRTGIRVNTLLHATQPLETEPYDAFGYRGNDREMTRYAVSDATGKIRIENLPAIPIVVEVLIPTSNFSEQGRNWDLLMETVPGELHPTWMEMAGRRGGTRDARGENQPAAGERPQLSSVSRREGPAVVTLKGGETLKYPKFVVRQQLALSVSEWSSVEANDFVLWWGAANGDREFDHYEVEMMLTAPQQTPSHLPSQRVIRSTTVESNETHWAVGQDGVGGQRLRPGNIYMFEVRAVGREGKVLARLPKTRVWVPWPDRKTQSPEHGVGGVSELPFYDQMWWNSGTQVAGGERIDNRQRIDEFLAGNKDRFEYAYIQMGQAWLQCLDRKTEAGRATLERLAKDLPEGNIVRATSKMLLQRLDAGQALPQRLEFVGEE